jgi:RNA polymerase sigma factor (sigma-70 family)
MQWDDLTNEEREAYVNQDYVPKDDRILSVGGDAELDWLRMHHSPMDYACIVHDFELGEEEIEVIKKCGLTERQEKCIIMHYVDGMSERDIGKRLSISQPTVHEHLEVGREKIWKELKHLAGDYYVNRERKRKEEGENE